MKKVTVIGAGNVGATTAMKIAEMEIADLVLLDIVEGLSKGKALDLLQSAPVENYNLKIVGTNSYSEMEGSDIVIITAGLPRQPGMSRDDLLQKNFTIIKGIAQEIKNFAPDAVIIIVTNPLDVMAYTVLKTTGFSKNRILGMAGILDSARFKTFIASELDISVKDISSMVLGSHGDTMVPLPEYTTIAGIPIRQFLSSERINDLIERTRKGGAEIVSYLKTGSAYYAPASSAAEMAEAVIRNSNRILPCSVYVEGEYGYNGIFIGLPVKVGRSGVEEIITIELDDEAKQALDRSANAVKETISKLKFN